MQILSKNSVDHLHSENEKEKNIYIIPAVNYDNKQPKKKKKKEERERIN